MKLLFVGLIFLISCHFQSKKDETLKVMLKDIGIQQEVEIVSYDSKVISIGPLGSDSYTEYIYELSIVSHKALLREVENSFMIIPIISHKPNTQAQWSDHGDIIEYLNTQRLLNEKYSLRIKKDIPQIVLSTL